MHILSLCQPRFYALAVAPYRMNKYEWVWPMSNEYLFIQTNAHTWPIKSEVISPQSTYVKRGIKPSLALCPSSIAVSF